MKKVFNGKSFNTETAKELGTIYSAALPDSLEYFSETLYLTKSGNYFIHGAGGPRSPYYDIKTVNGITGSVAGEHIRPVSPDEARAWGKEHLAADEYTALFEIDMESVDTKEKMSIVVSAACKSRLRRIRERTGKTFSQIIEESVMSCYSGEKGE